MLKKYFKSLQECEVNSDGQNDVYEEEMLEDDMGMEEDLDLDVRLQMLHLKEAEIKLKKKMLLLNQHKKMTQQANRSILPDGRIVVRNIGERAPVQENFSSAPVDTKTPSSCEESSCKGASRQHEEDMSNSNNDSGEVNSILKCCSDIDDGILEEITEALLDENCDIDIPLDVVIDHITGEEGCDVSNICDIDRLKILRENDYANVDADLKFVLALAGYPRAKIHLHDIKRFNQYVKDIIETQKANNLIQIPPTFLDCYVNNGAIVCVFKDIESKRWLLMVLPGIKERMNCDFLLLKLETVRLYSALIISPAESSKTTVDVLKQLENLNPDLKTCQWKIVKEISVSNITYISIVIDEVSFEIIRGASFKNVINFYEMEFEIERSIDIYGKTLSLKEDFSSVASRVNILKSLNTADTQSLNDNTNKFLGASNTNGVKYESKKYSTLHSMKAYNDANSLKTLRATDYNEIDEELKIIIALSDYPTSKIRLQNMTNFLRCLNDIIDMQEKANLLKHRPTFLDCYINKGAIVCIFNDVDSKQWFIRVSPGLQERMNCGLQFMKSDTTRLYFGEIKIKDGLSPAAVIGIFKNMKLLNPKLNNDNWRVISKEYIKGKIYTLCFLINNISYEVIRSTSFQNIIDYDQIEFEVKGGEQVYYRKMFFDSDLLSFQSRVKLLKDFKPDIFKSSDLKIKILTENNNPDHCDSLNEESSDEMYSYTTLKSTVSTKSDKCYSINVESSDEMYTEDSENDLQNRCVRNAIQVKLLNTLVIQNNDADPSKNPKGDKVANFDKESQLVPDTIETDSGRHSLLVSADQDIAVAEHLLRQNTIPSHNLTEVQKGNHEIFSNDCNKLNSSCSNSWELRIRISEDQDRKNENEIEFENPNQINYSKTEDTVKLNIAEQDKVKTTICGMKSEPTMKIDNQEIVNNCLSMGDICASHIVSEKEVTTLVNSINGSNANIILGDMKYQNTKIKDEVVTYECTEAKDENETSIQQTDSENSHELLLDSCVFDDVMCDLEVPDDQNEPDAPIMSTTYVHKDFKNVDFTKDIDNKAENMEDKVLTGDNNYFYGNRRKELSYYRCTKYYFHVDKELKLAIVLDEYPTAKLEKSHLRQISRLFNEYLIKDVELFCDVIPQFEDVYISNGAFVFICETVETREYLIEILPELSKSMGLKLKIYNIARLLRFYRVSMTLPPDISHLEFKTILPTLQLSYSNLQTNLWKIYSDIPGEEKRVFGLDGKSLRFLRKANMTFEYDQNIITCEEVKRPRPNVEPNVVNPQSTKEIKNNLKEKIIKMMYCELIFAGKNTSLKYLRNSYRKNNYCYIVPDDFKLYISASNYPEIHIDELNFNEIKSNLEGLVADNWGTFEPFVPRIYDMYLNEGTVFVICKDIQTRIWIESNIRNIGLTLDYSIMTTEYRGVVGSVTMILKTKRSFEEAVAILQDQNPRLRTKYWRKVNGLRLKHSHTVLQMDFLSAQVIRSNNFNGYVDGKIPEFGFSPLLSATKARPGLDPFDNEDYKVNIVKETNLDEDKENDKCEKCLIENDVFYYSGNKHYNIMEMMGDIDADDYCKVDLKIPVSILTAKGCLDIIFEVLNEKNPNLNTFLWKIEPCSDEGHFTVFIDKTSACVIQEDNFDSSFAGEELDFEF